ncbi:hypothetical protein [Pseudomonas syringae]|uniref:hypothetical protein n=1 Tax=Pseudomonas syringae TaxID=317 RepID=UPI003C13012A
MTFFETDATSAHVLHSIWLNEVRSQQVRKGQGFVYSDDLASAGRRLSRRFPSRKLPSQRLIGLLSIDASHAST